MGHWQICHNHKFAKSLPNGIHPLLPLGTSLPPNSCSKLMVCFKPFHLFHSNRQMMQRLWSQLSMFCGNNVGVLALGRFFMTQRGRNGTPQELSLLSLEQLVFGYGSCEQTPTPHLDSSLEIIIYSRKKC